MAKENKHEGDENAPARKTVFVRNLPFSATSKQLEEIFSNDAPVKQAFVVKDKDNHNKCRGFGYVQFVLQEDADKAVASAKSIGDRKLNLCYANKKPKHEKRKKAKMEESGEEQIENQEKSESKEVTTEIETETEIKPETGAKTKKSPKSPKQNKAKQEDKATTGNKSELDKSELHRTLVLTGLTSKVKRKAFRIMCEKFGEVENIVFPVPERTEVTAFVRFKDYKSTIRAIQKIPGQKVKKSHALSAVLLTKEGKFPSKKALDKSRLIVRNLSFKVELDELRECFSKFGKVVDVNIPTKIVNRKPVKIGCGFVQFQNPANGKLALEAMNMKEIQGRTVIVDWAVKKDEYEAGKNKQDKKVNVKTEEKVKKVDDEEENADEDEEETNEDEEGSEIEDNEGEEMEESAEEDGGSEMESDEEDMEDESDIDEEREARMKEKLKDAKEGKTVFIRNMSYNTDDEAIMEEFEKYGEIDYCKVVMDKETGHSKGCAFLKFKDKDAADKCVEEIEKLQSEEKNVVVDGRSIVVSKAVTKGKMGEIERQKAADKQESDKRNLYLAYEGVITRNSPGADSLSEIDLKHREKALAEKKAKLKNPQYFVSRTRLCIRNLPMDCNADVLKKAFVKHTKNESIKISDAKIMRSKDRKDERGTYRSLGFGFIDVDNHESALKLLRATNNNPEIFGEKRRPIVEFSVENSKALKVLELKKRKIDQMKIDKENEENDSGKTLDGKERKGTDEKKEGEKDGDYDFVKHRHYKEKAKEQRHKRNLRYRKKREDKRKLREESGEPPKENTAVKKTKLSAPKNNNEPTNNTKPAPVAKKPLAKTVENDRKRSKQDDTVEDSGEASNKRSRKMNTVRKEKEESKFDSLVSQYKNKLNANVGKPKKKAGEDRWFE